MNEQEPKTELPEISESGKPIAYIAIDKAQNLTKLHCPYLNITVEAPISDHSIKGPFEEIAFSYAMKILGPSSSPNPEDISTELIDICKRITDNATHNLPSQFEYQTL